MITADSVETRSEIRRRLASAQKSNRGAAGYSRWVNRRLGRLIAVEAYRLGLTPNQVSWISAAFTFGSIACLASIRPGWVLAVLVTLGLLLGYAFDSADGQVARLRGGGSPAGEWLDHVLDAVKASTIHLAVVVSWFRYYHFEHARILLIPLGFCAISAVFYFAVTLSDMLRRIASTRDGGTGVATAAVDPTEHAPVLRSLVVLPNDYGVLCLSFLLIAWHDGFVVVYTALFVVNLLILLGAARRWFAEMGALATAR